MEFESCHTCAVLTTLKMSISVTLKSCNAFILLPQFMGNRQKFSVTITLVKCACMVCVLFISFSSFSMMIFELY